MANIVLKSPKLYSNLHIFKILLDQTPNFSWDQILNCARIFPDFAQLFSKCVTAPTFVGSVPASFFEKNRGLKFNWGLPVLVKTGQFHMFYLGNQFLCTVISQLNVQNPVLWSTELYSTVQILEYGYRTVQ